MKKMIISSHLFTKKTKTMKKFFMIAAMMVAALTVNAQNEAGQITIQPKVGMNLSTLSEDGSKMKVGLAAGVEAEYGVAENFGIAVGALYSMQGAKVENSDLKMLLDYINVPIVAQFYPIKGLAIKAGAQFGFNVRSKISDGDHSVKMEDFFKAEGINAKQKSLDISIPVGISYEISNIVIDARYNFGLTKVMDPFKDKNRVFQLTVGYKFGL